MKKALLLCSSHNDLGLVRALRKLGYYIIVTGNRVNLPGQKWCDEFIFSDYSNKEKILEIAKEKNIDAIIQCCNDFGVYTAAYVAEKLGLPGYDSYETTLMLHNKDLFKEFAKKNNITSPISESFSSEKEALQHLDSCTYPVIIKPTDCSAGNGIHKAENKTEGSKYIQEAFLKSRAKRIVIESYIQGTQHGFCTFLRNQKVCAICSNNEYSFLNPYRVEIDTYPADNFDLVQESLVAQIEKIARILNLKDGIFHLQYIHDGKNAQIIEVMRRILGNMYHVPGNALTGIDWEYWDTRVRCGLDISAMPSIVDQTGCFAYKTILATKNGKIKSIHIPSRYNKYLDSVFMLKHEGDVVENYMSEPIGFMFFCFPDQQTMKNLLIESYINDAVTIE
jgi:biotin carboxylase